MRFGVCTSIDEAECLAEIGYDYVEVNASALAAMTDAQFAAFCRKNEAARIHAECANCLFPGEIRLTGEGVNEAEIAAYIERVTARLGAAGVQIAVFGSGGSRRVPEGFSAEAAEAQLVKTARMLGEAAEKNGLTVVLEPLRREETNILNTQAAGLSFVRRVNHPHFKLLCDYYHLVSEGGTMEDVALCGGALCHTHIANPDGRVAMRAGDSADYKAFFDTLHAIGYGSRMSLECNEASDEGRRAALAVMKSL